MTETMANATYRGFNYPHQISSYWAMYHVARHTTLPTVRDWHWYLYRAGKTALKLGTSNVGFMDGTVAREVLAALLLEGEAGNTTLAAIGAQLRGQMQRRQQRWAVTPHPYGSEFGFDTTGQEEVRSPLDTSQTPPTHLQDTSSTPPTHLLHTSYTPPRHLLDTTGQGRLAYPSSPSLPHPSAGGGVEPVLWERDRRKAHCRSRPLLHALVAHLALPRRRALVGRRRQQRQVPRHLWHRRARPRADARAGGGSDDSMRPPHPPPTPPRVPSSPGTTARA